MRYLLALLFFASFSFAQAPPAAKREPLVDQVQKSIERGTRYLRRTQQMNGSWEVEESTAFAVTNVGGQTALAILALLNSGTPTSDPIIAGGLKYLRTLDVGETYTRALITMAYVEAKQPEDRSRIQANIKWLIDTRVIKEGKLAGWNYHSGPIQHTDNSNTQYALLGLWAGKQAGIPIERELWEAIRDYYIRTQTSNGAWIYEPFGGKPSDASITMTSAGICGLLIAGTELNEGRESLQPDGTAQNCGEYKENEPIAKGLQLMGKFFQVNPDQRTFYSLYGIERLGRLTGQRFLGDHDWYREGCDFLVKNQKENGSWQIQSTWDNWPIVSTSFSLLFLSKGRTPVLISKLVHGSFPRRAEETDWNNDRNDLRHLVEFSSKELFKDLPLAWQSFDILRAAVPQNRGGLTDEDIQGVTADLLQAPVAYITGHKSPRFGEVEKRVLKEYVDNGGLILAEACCGNPEFDRGFRALVGELWPDATFAKLEPEHPVWTSHFLIAPGNPYELWGLSLGCKTVLIYSPKDLSCQWEANAVNDKAGLGDRAFKLGANVVAYATGMEPPRPRLTQVAVIPSTSAAANIPRGFIQIAQLKYAGDWKPAPRAMRNLLDHLHKVAGLDVAPEPVERSIYDKAIRDFEFIYMQGRGEFQMKAEDLGHLRFVLAEKKGMLFADASCGQETFDKSFRAFMAQLFPKNKLEQVPVDDRVFSKDLNGEGLTLANVKGRMQKTGPLRAMMPYLEGIKIDNRWVVLYSKYDVGCALERHQSTDCMGYAPDSALKIAGAALLYSLSP